MSRQAGNQVNAAQAQVRYAQSQLQQAIADRNAAQQRASQEEDGYVPASYDSAVAEAEAELRAANREYQEASRELMEADRELTNAEGSLEESSRALRGVAAELQQVSDKYGIEMGKTRALMSLPHAELASPLLQQLGIGQGRVDDLRQRIAASLGIAMGGTSSGYGGGYGGRGGGRQRAVGGYGGASGYSGGGSNTPHIHTPTVSAAPTNSGGTAAVASGGAANAGGKYVKTTYSHPVTYTHPQTGERVTRVSNRTVYENRELDPNMIIPAGTRRSNGTVITRDTTNLELMRAGNAPFIAHRYANGTTELAQVELHHLSGEETQHGSQFFRGEDVDGSMVEISSLTHDKYSRQLHLGTPSFRRGRRKEKTEDGVKYTRFRESYWKHRAAKYDAVNGK